MNSPFPPLGLVTAVDTALNTHSSLKNRSNATGILEAIYTFGIYDVSGLDAVLRNDLRSMKLSEAIGKHAPDSFVSILSDQRAAHTPVPKPVPQPPAFQTETLLVTVKLGAETISLRNSVQAFPSTTYHELLRMQLKGHADEAFLLKRPSTVGTFTAGECLPSEKASAPTTDPVGTLACLGFRFVQLQLSILTDVTVRVVCETVERVKRSTASESTKFVGCLRKCVQAVYSRVYWNHSTLCGYLQWLYSVRGSQPRQHRSHPGQIHGRCANFKYTLRIYVFRGSSAKRGGGRHTEQRIKRPPDSQVEQRSLTLFPP